MLWPTRTTLGKSLLLSVQIERKQKWFHPYHTEAQRPNADRLCSELQQQASDYSPRKLLLTCPPSFYQMGDQQLSSVLQRRPITSHLR